jgi:hypothetical protein
VLERIQLPFARSQTVRIVFDGGPDGLLYGCLQLRAVLDRELLQNGLGREHDAFIHKASVIVKRRAHSRMRSGRRLLSLAFGLLGSAHPGMRLIEQLGQGSSEE